MEHWKIGDVTIRKVIEIETSGKATWILPDATAENLRAVGWCQPHFVSAEGQAVISVHALLVESRGQRIVVDTCIGNHKNLPGFSRWHGRTGGTFLADLAEAGFPPDHVNTVLCTHLHVDHVGWNTYREDGRWLPTFPNARHLWNRAEYEFWSSSEGIQDEVVAESVVPVFEAGLVDLVSEDHTVNDEVRLEPTPGHTPGHVSVHITSRGEEAVITGDLAHHPAQLAHPEWRSRGDWDGEKAEATRRTFLERYSDRPVLVIGTHFATPSAGHIVRDGDAWRLDV